MIHNVAVPLDNDTLTELLPNSGNILSIHEVGIFQKAIQLGDIYLAANSVLMSTWDLLENPNNRDSHILTNTDVNGCETSDVTWEFSRKQWYDYNKLVICRRTEISDGIKNVNIVILYNGNVDVLNRYLRSVNITYKLTPFDIHNLPSTVNLYNLNTLVKQAKAKLNNALIDIFNANELKSGVKYELNDDSTIVYTSENDGYISDPVTVVAATNLESGTISLSFEITHVDDAVSSFKVLLGPALLDLYRKYTNVLIDLATYNENARSGCRINP